MKFENRIFEDGRVGVINELIQEPLPVSESYKLMKLLDYNILTKN